jgi:hypothetical protein
MTAFGSAIGGGGDVIQEAMARRGMGGGATAQVSPGSPNFQNANMSNNIPSSVSSPIPSSTSSPQSPSGDPEAKIILGAMSGYLKSITKQKEMGAR